MLPQVEVNNLGTFLVLVIQTGDTILREDRRRQVNKSIATYSLYATPFQNGVMHISCIL